MPEPKTPVVGDDTAEVEPKDSTLGTEEQVSDTETHSTEPSDAETIRKELEALREESRKQLERLSTDLNRQKSSFQRRESELIKQFKDREAALERRAREAELADLDDNEKAEYLKDIANQELTEMQNKLAQLEQEKSELLGKQSAITFFTNQGVPMKELVTDGTMEDLVQSGYSFMARELTELRKLKEGSQKETKPEEPPKKPKPAPKVDKGAGSGSATGLSWEDLKNRYKTDEEGIFRMVDQGLLPPTIIPVKKS